MPSFVRPVLLACAVAMTLAGCQSKRERASLRSQVAALSLKIDSLIIALETQRENDSIKIDESTMLFVPGDSDHYIRTQVGFLTARLDSFRDFGSGSRATFWLGNPGYVTLQGMRARLEWKVRTESGDTFHSPVAYEFMEDLKPGKLTPVRVVVEDIPAARLLGIRVSRVRFQEVAFSAK